MQRDARKSHAGLGAGGTTYLFRNMASDALAELGDEHLRLHLAGRWDKVGD